jgi:peptidoglycan/LPS O-acetylase OafA/YrhL
MYVAFGLLRMLPAYPALLLVTSCGLFVWPIPSEIFALHGFSTGFLFFVFGVLASEYLKIERGYVLPIWGTLVVSSVLFVSGWYVFAGVIGPVRLPDGSHPLFFLFFSAMGITACIGLAQWLAEKQWCGFVKIFGQFSLQIYLVHMLAGVAARVVLLQLFHVTNPFLHMIVGVSAGLIVPIILYKTALKMRMTYLFEWNRPRLKVEGI